MTDIIIFFAVAAGFLAIAYLLGARRRHIRSRIASLRQRNTHHVAADLSLKRKQHTPHGPLAFQPRLRALSDRLERAGYTLSAEQYILRRLLWLAGITLLVGVIFKKSLLLGFFLGIILGVWLPMKWMQRAINKQRKAFLRLFPDAIDLIVRGLRSGLPVSESVVLVASEVPDPVGSIFSTINHTMKLGVTLEKALQDTARRLDLTEFNFFTTSIILQRETGGNLSEILGNLGEVLRGRYIMGMKIKAMSSEARASAMIIGALPFIVILAVSVLSPGYLLPLIDDPRGNIAAFTAAGMMSFGLWSMNRMTKFEI